MFLLKLLVVSFAGFVSARPSGFHTSFHKSAHIKIAAPVVSLAPAPTVSYSDPVTPKVIVSSAPAYVAPKVTVSSGPAHVAPVSSITTRIQYDPHALGRKAQRIVGVLTDIARSVGNFVSETVRDLAPPKIITTVSKAPVIKTVQHSAPVIKTVEYSAPVVKTVTKEVY